MELIQTTSKSEIKKILFDDEIWSRISEDGQEKPDDILMNRGCHLKAISDKDEYVGLVFLHSINLSTIEVHINIIKRYRNDYAYVVGKEIIKLFTELPDRINKMICHIPVCYPDVYNFTIKFGFKAEGIRRESTYKSGSFIDEYCLGITKKEAREWQKQLL